MSYSVFDPEFYPYGQVLTGWDTGVLCAAMEAVPLPEAGTAYEPSVPALEACGSFDILRNHVYGGMPIQLGMCWGRNTRLNCLEYHRDSEVNVGTHDFVLLLARREEIVEGVLDTAAVKAFRVPAGVAVELYATTLHYAPCHTEEAVGFRVAVALPRGTNTEKPAIRPLHEEDVRLFARNKWLLAHPQSFEAAQGAYVGLKGENIDLADFI